MRARLPLFAASAAITFALACRGQSTAPATQPSTRTPLIYIIYYTGEDTPPSPVAITKELATQNGNARWNESNGPDDGLIAFIQPTEKYAPPKLESLKYFGRGITNDDARKLQDSKLCLTLTFKRDWATHYELLHSAEMLVHTLAARTHGFIWDESARLMYSPASFKELVLDHWKNDIPSVRREVEIHEYADDDRMRAVTLGMEKFGLPNLVINNLERSTASSLGSLIVLCAQTMVENRPRTIGEDVTVNLDRIRQPDIRDWMMPTLLEGATKRAVLPLKPVKPEQGDADTPLYEISFDGEKADTLFERQNLLVARVFGKRDEAMGVKHDAEMLALVQKAQRQLQALKPHFQAGLLPGETLLVQSPFHENGHEEWMWVEVNKWDGDTITGSLQNDPDIVKSLKAGATVNVKASESFDFLFVHSDRSSEGNETSKLIEKRGH